MARHLLDYEYREMRDVWGDFNRRQEFEHELIDRKTNWLLTTEGLLFAAYGVSFEASETPSRFRSSVAWAGLLIAAITLVGVLAVMNSKRMSWGEYQRFYGREGSGELPQPFPRQRDGRGTPLAWGVRTSNTVLTLAPDLVIPAVFIGVWWYLLS